MSRVFIKKASCKNFVQIIFKISTYDKVKTKNFFSSYVVLSSKLHRLSLTKYLSFVITDKKGHKKTEDFLWLYFNVFFVDIFYVVHYYFIKSKFVCFLNNGSL